MLSSIWYHSTAIRRWWRLGHSSGLEMAVVLRKFMEAAKVLAKSPIFSRDPRHLQFEADMNLLFLSTSYKRLGKNSDGKDIDEITDIASKASVSDQQKQVQENIHLQFKSLCEEMDKALQPHFKNSGSQTNAFQPSGLSLAIGRQEVSRNRSAIPETQPLTQLELSQSLKTSVGYTLDLKPSQIPHPDAGRGLFISGEAEMGSIIAIYPGIIYSPANYRYIPGYPRVDTSNSYLITRYDGNVINAQPWGVGGKEREEWDFFSYSEHRSDIPQAKKSTSDRIWTMLSKPSEINNHVIRREVMERRNPLAFAHFANHPSKGQQPNVMVCPYDFPISEKEMRPYVPNISFGDENNVNMKRYGSFWFRTGSSADGKFEGPTIKTLVLVASRDVCEEELLLNYRLSNLKARPGWYTPVDEEEDRRRWS